MQSSKQFLSEWRYICSPHLGSYLLIGFQELAFFQRSSKNKLFLRLIKTKLFYFKKHWRSVRECDDGTRCWYALPCCIETFAMTLFRNTSYHLSFLHRQIVRVEGILLVHESMHKPHYLSDADLRKTRCMCAEVFVILRIFYIFEILTHPRTR